MQKAPAPAVASKSGAKGAAAGAAANPSSSTRGISVTEPLPLQQPPKEWSAVTVAEAAAAQARVALLLQENAKLTEALRDVKEEVKRAYTVKRQIQSSFLVLASFPVPCYGSEWSIFF